MKDDPVLDLLAHEEDEAIPADHERRIRAGLGALLAPPPSSPPGGGEGTGGGAAPGSSVAASAAKGALGKWIALGVVALGAGGIGVAIGRATAPVPPPVIVHAPAPPPVTQPPPVAPAAGPSSVVVDDNQGKTPTTTKEAPSQKTAASSDAFDREQSLLERARSALVRHDAAAAEQALDECDRQFPRSRHAEERDYLRIQTLREKGDTERARQKARAFLERYPDSLLRSRVEAIAR